ncbi:sialidase family protein [Porticoccaceae bacterium LTM1]|nr:sialidase family protein [Porticoccaceae bacterium LTM1]
MSKKSFFRKRTLVFILGIAALAVILSMKKPDADISSSNINTSNISVGPNVQVSAALPNIAHAEVIMCAHPTNPNHLLGVSMMESRKGDVTEPFQLVAYASHDGGKSWEFSIDSRANDVKAADPSCAYGRDGSIYISGMVFTAESRSDGDDEGASELHIYHSKDFGRTWLPPVIAPGSYGIDRMYTAVDNTKGEYDGRVYINGHLTKEVDEQGNHGDMLPILFHSEDHGKSFQSVRKSVGSALSGTLTEMVVMSDGTVGWLYNLTNKDRKSVTKFMSSDDGGESINHVVKLDTSGEVKLALDPGSNYFKDRLYLVWSRPVISLEGVPSTSHLVISHSDDKGKTWSVPRIVPGGDRAYMPNVVVNPQGVVGIMWYEGGEGDQQLTARVRFTASLDGGDTFQPAVWVDHVPGGRKIQSLSGSPVGYGAGKSHNINPADSQLNLSVVSSWLGHTSGLAADADGNFHPLWIDTRTGIPQVWTARVTVPIEAAPYGSPSLANFKDVTPLVEVQMEDVVFDFGSKRITANATLNNISDTTINGSIVVRALSWNSAIGEMEVIDADNKVKGHDAYWDFTKLIPEGGLIAGASTKNKTITLQFSELQINRYMPFLTFFSFQVIGDSVFSASKP